MTDIQLFILAAIPLVGILANTGLFHHVGARVDRLAERMDARFDVLLGKDSHSLLDPRSSCYP